MSSQQAELLKKCISALRSAECRLDELVEVGPINAVNRKTAESLVNAGVLVYDMPSWATKSTATHVRFPHKGEYE
jgi:hypothetical protein